MHGLGVSPLLDKSLQGGMPFAVAKLAFASRIRVQIAPAGVTPNGQAWHAGHWAKVRICKKKSTNSFNL